MQILKDKTPGVNLVTGLDAHAVRINEQVHHQSLIVNAGEVSVWPLADVAQLDDSHWEAVLATRPEIIILGTGRTLCFPEPRQMRATLENGIGVEVMDTEAACRTYNLLVHEGRIVTAALIIA